ncbi:hypothetical protein Ancab_003139 [Ancistrocladus abbreviatus]
MVKISRALMKEAGVGISKVLSEILVCPLTKKPLRYCEKTNSLISDDIGVSFPIVDGIPCLVPKDGKILQDDELLNVDNSVDSNVGNEKTQGTSRHSPVS